MPETADTLPVPTREAKGVGWVCRSCGAPVNEPSIGLGRAWCPVCESYESPTQSVAA
jgi:hypothetical protein